MALSGKERQRNFIEDQNHRGLVPAPRGWVPQDQVYLVKELIDRLRKAHREQTDIQPE